MNTNPGRNAYPGSVFADREKGYPENLSAGAQTDGLFRMRPASGKTQTTDGFSQ
jgi:hypothetical protein